MQESDVEQSSPSRPRAGGEHESIDMDSYIYAPHAQHLIAALERTISTLNNSMHPSMHRPVRYPKLTRNFTNRILLITLALQILNLILLTVIDETVTDDASLDSRKGKEVIAGIVVMAAFQFVHLIVIVAVSIKLTKQVLHHTVTNSFLVQSYLSTIILFAGIYTLLFRIDEKSWIGITTTGAKHSLFAFDLFVRMLYYSTATMTSTGYGDIRPTAWYLYLLAITEMLLGVVYTTVIFARGLTALGGMKKPSSDDGRPKRALVL